LGLEFGARVLLGELLAEFLLLLFVRPLGDDLSVDARNDALNYFCALEGRASNARCQRHASQYSPSSFAHFL
jgi:hypothetical protein